MYQRPMSVDEAKKLSYGVVIEYFSTCTVKECAKMYLSPSFKEGSGVVDKGPVVISCSIINPS